MGTIQNGYELTGREEDVAGMVVNCAYRVHRQTGPGMLESVYELCFCHELKKMGLDVKRQVPIDICYDGILFNEAFRVDIWIENLVVCELKSVQELTRVHYAQLLTYLKFTQNHVGFLLNFNTDLMKNGTRRIVLP